MEHTRKETPNNAHLTFMKVQVWGDGENPKSSICTPKTILIKKMMMMSCSILLKKESIYKKVDDKKREEKKKMIYKKKMREKEDSPLLDLCYHQGPWSIHTNHVCED